MSISTPFIRRPVATTLLTIGLALAGSLAFSLLPVSPMPNVDLPTIVVSASLPGASPETVATSVTTPLERHLGTIAGVTEMTSQSAVGSSRVTLQFDLARNIDGAARDVEAAIQAARIDLPSSLRSNPAYRKLNPSDAPVLILALTSDTLTAGQIYDSASTILQQKLLQVDGIGDVTIGGSSLPAVRIELNPRALFRYGIGLEDVRAALSAANANSPKGAVDYGNQRYQIYVNDTATRAAEYQSLIVAYRNNAGVRLQDVALVTDGVENIRNLGLADGKPAVLLVLHRQPGANVIDVVDRIRALIPELQASIPASISIIQTNDRTETIRASLRDVERTLLIAIALVVFVVFLTLRNVRAATVPSVAVPLSLIGTFGAMYLLGFSLDNLSLMALTVATGFVVDDAIVVLENISRHVEEGMSRFQAALLGAREVGFTVLAMSLSLIAVFIPILLMGGIVGRTFREFALTLSVAIIISLIVSLTTTPMMCAHVLRAGTDSQGRFMNAMERGFNAMRDFYGRTLNTALAHPRTVMLVLAVTVALNFYLYTVVPKGFFPQQDTGTLVGNLRADQSISFQAMSQKLREVQSIVQNDQAVQDVVGFTGGGGGGPGAGGGATNTANLFVGLKPLQERKASSDRVIARLRLKLSRITGVRLFLQSIQDIRAGGRQTNSQYQYTVLSDDLNLLYEWMPKITDALKLVPELEDINSDRQDNGLDVSLNIDRSTAARLGVNLSEIDNTLYDAFGQRQVSTIYNDMNQYHVVMEVDPGFWQSPETLKEVWVSTSGGALSGTQSSAAASSDFQTSASTSVNTSPSATVATPSTTTTTSITPVASTTTSPSPGTSGTSSTSTTGATPGTTSTTAATTTVSASLAPAGAAANLALNSLTNSGRGGASTGASIATSTETTVPLAAFANYGPSTTPLAINHQGPFVATTFSFNLPEGESLSTAIAAIQRTMQQIHVPISVHGSFAGTAQVFQQSLKNEPWLIAAAIVAVYIVLGVLYESYVHPITILSTLPSAGVGAVLALLAFGTEFSLIALIGVILLIGIVKKNAIMMIDVALETERARQVDPRTAIYDACLLRFRPIMMTTFAALLGAIPLAVTTGSGAEMRQPLGISIVGGLIFSQVLTLYTTPVVYLYLDRFRLWLRGSKSGGDQPIDHAPAAAHMMPTLRLKSTASCCVAVAVALSGCAIGPNYHRPSAPIAPEFKEDKGWKPASPGQIRSDKPWWSIYNDPLLDSLEQQVEVSNQTLIADEAAYRAAVEVVAIDRGGLLPSISATGSYTRAGTGTHGASQAISTGSGTITTGATNTNNGTGTATTKTPFISDTRNIYSVGAQGTWTLDVWGRIRRQIESDVAKAQVSAADVAAAKLSAQITLAEDYFQLRAADEQARLYKTDIEDFKNALTITQNQVKAGITTLADVYAAETQVESTEASAVNVELTRAKFEHAIAVLTGRPPSELTIPDGEFTTVVPVVPAGVPSTLLERRPDVAAAERGVASANALIGVAESAWFPNVTLNGSYSFASAVLRGLLQTKNSLWSFGPSLAENLFNGGATLAATREARANYDQAVATYRQTVLSAFQSVEDDLVSLRVLENQGELQKTAVRDARLSEQLTLNQYKSGIVAYSSVITAQTTRLADEISLLSIQSQALVSSVDLISQVGGGWEASELDRKDRGVPSPPK